MCFSSLVYYSNLVLHSKSALFIFLHPSFFIEACLWIFHLMQKQSELTTAHSLVVSHSFLCLKPPLLTLHLFQNPLHHPHADPLLSTPSPGPLSLVRGLAVRPSPVSAAAVISSGPSGGLLLTSQAWDRVTSSLNMMGLNQQCVRLNREGETKQLRGLSANK